MTMHIRLSVCSAACLAASAVLAQPVADWKWDLSPNITGGTYQGSETRQRYSESGARLSASYRDQASFKLGLSNTTIGMKAGAQDTQQTNQLLSGSWNFLNSAAYGRWTARLDLHDVRNNDQSDFTDRVIAWAAQTSWLDSAGNLYLDLGYAQSRYQRDWVVNQVTPTLGFAFNNRYDWLQLRGYLINTPNNTPGSATANTQENLPQDFPGNFPGNLPMQTTTTADRKTSFSAFEVKWSHYFMPSSAWYQPTLFTASVMGGERVYAVDMDAQSVANLPDSNLGSASLGLAWQLAKSARLFALVGQNKFRTSSTNTDYTLNVAHATLSFDF